MTNRVKGRGNYSLVKVSSLKIPMVRYAIYEMTSQLVSIIYCITEQRNWDSSVGMMTGIRARRPEFDARQRSGFLLFATV
jgi:hypothetical protein